MTKPGGAWPTFVFFCENVKHDGFVMFVSPAELVGDTLTQTGHWASIMTLATLMLLLVNSFSVW